MAKGILERKTQVNALELRIGPNPGVPSAEFAHIFLDEADGILKLASANGDVVSMDPSVLLTGAQSIESDGADYDGTDSSYQLIGVDLNLAAGAGSDTLTNPKFLAPIMGNILGDGLTESANYLAGLIGAYSITDEKATEYPTAAVMGLIFDSVDDIDAIVLAVIDGDDPSGATRARAAFGVAINNNHANSGVDYGLDLYAAGNPNYTGGGTDFACSIADVRFANGLCLASLSTAITANVTDTTLPAGSMAITSHATGQGTLFYSDGAKFQAMQVPV